MSMREELRKEMNTFIAEIVIRDGQAVEIRESVYGWQDTEAQRHIAGWDAEARKKATHLGCPWVFPVEPAIKEHNLGEYHDTDHNTNSIVVDVMDLECQCGKLTNRTVRYFGTLGEFIPKLFFGENYDPAG